MLELLAIGSLVLTIPPLPMIMDHPYMDPNQCPWTEEFQESYGYRKASVNWEEECRSRYWEGEEEEYHEALYGVI